MVPGFHRFILEALWLHSQTSHVSLFPTSSLSKKAFIYHNEYVEALAVGCLIQLILNFLDYKEINNERMINKIRNILNKEHKIFVFLHQMPISN